MSQHTLSLSELLPVYNTVGGALAATYEPYGENIGYSIINTNKDEFSAFADGLYAMGATRYTSNIIGDNRFFTFLLPKTGDREYTVYLMFYAISCNVRIILTPRGYLPPLTAEDGNEPTYIYQPVRDGIYNGNRGDTITGAPGMAYVIALSDGTFLLIDSGPRCSKVKVKYLDENGEWADEEERPADDAKKLFDFIKAHTKTGEKPIISAWFFTHPHSDHVHTAFDFLERYKDDVEVRLGAFQFPDFEKHPTKHENNEVLKSLVDTTAERLLSAGATLWNFHTGEQLALPGCNVEILYTPEDYIPHGFSWGNHTSSAFRLTFAGKTFMVLGDCEKDICQTMSDRYGTYLKSDILQVSHHGVNGACVALYRDIDPLYCLWPIDVFRFMTDGRCTGAISHSYHFNAWLRNDLIRKRFHYHNSTEVAIRTDIP